MEMKFLIIDQKRRKQKKKDMEMKCIRIENK